MYVDDLILSRISIPSVLRHVEQRTKDFFGVDSEATLDIEHLVRAYGLVNDPGVTLNELLESRSILEEIAYELGISIAKEALRSELIDAIVERGLGFRRLRLEGSSNFHERITSYQRRLFGSRRTRERYSPEELREAGINCSSIVEQTTLYIFALHAKLLFDSLDFAQRERIRGVEKGGYRFGTVVEKLRNLERKALPNDEKLQAVLEKRVGRSWIIRESTLDTAAQVHKLRSIDLAHQRSAASWRETEPIVRPIIELSLKFMDEVLNDKLLPFMLLQVRSITDEWGRSVILCLAEDDFDQDGRPKSINFRFDEDLQIKADECLLMQANGVPFRPRVPCYCLPDDFTLPLTEEIRLFFSDELRHFPPESELGYE